MEIDLQKLFTYPYDGDLLLRKRKGIRRTLLAQEGAAWLDKRIAILGGSTTEEAKDILELFLLASGIRPAFFQSEYGRFYEDAVFGSEELDAFAPDVVILFTSVRNILAWPAAGCGAAVDAEYGRFEAAWEALARRHAAVIIQNNFDLPPEAPLGSLEASAAYGRHVFLAELNRRLAAYAQAHEGFYIHDLQGLAARIGLFRWHDPDGWCAYKHAMRYEVIPDVSHGLARIVRSIYGKAKKCLVLDLDNTLWGGVIGDDGADGIRIGRETPEAEAYTAFQAYVKELSSRGIILAVCSKNEADVARSGFCHPDSVLKTDDFAAFHANWEPKDRNIRAIAEEIGIGLDSLVFIDDNPAEREIVRQSLPEVAVPEVAGGDPASYIRAIEGAGYFEAVTVSEEDRKRSRAYAGNRKRKELAAAAGDYDAFLESLGMQAEIAPFAPVYYDRIAQLTNKTNQFNLTTRRFSRTQIERMADDARFVTLQGRLSDRFGDNGLVSVVIGERSGEELCLLLWLMSCRVLKRGMEDAMLDAVVRHAREADCKTLVGYYVPTKKNKMVAGLYPSLGFAERARTEEEAVYELALSGYRPRSKHIAIAEE